MPADPFTLFGTRRQLATVLGLSLPRLSQLTSLGILPKPSSRGHDLAKAVQAYIQSIRQGDGSLSRERQLLTRAKRKAEELKLRVREGELIERFATEQEAFETGRKVRDVLLSIPDRIAGVVTAESNQHTNHQTILHEVSQVCLELSKWCGSDHQQADPDHVRTRRTSRGNGKHAHPNP